MMKEYHIQTPKKELLQHANRRFKLISEHTKKPHKISQKCLNSVFTSVSEDSIEFSLISEISEDNHLRESVESFIAAPFALSDLTPLSSTIIADKDVGDVSVGRYRSAESKNSVDIVSVEAEMVVNHLKQARIQSFIASPNPVISPSLEMFTLSDLTPLSSTITADKDEVGDVSVGRCRSAESKNSVDIVSVEAGMVVNHLKQARIQVMNSTNADLRSKKLLNALIEVVIEEFNALPEERDRFPEIVSTKTRVVFLSFLLWILAVSVVQLFRSGVQSSFREPPPT